jgi:hypothetical protein
MHSLAVCIVVIVCFAMSCLDRSSVCPELPIPMGALWELHDTSTVLTVMSVAGTLPSAFSFDPPAITVVRHRIQLSMCARTA